MACNYDYRKLRGRIKEKFGTQSEFSKKLGLSEVSVSNKLNNMRWQEASDKARYKDGFQEYAV